MTEKYYKIKTNAGWFYTVSQGRYGRFSDDEKDGFALCEKCAEAIKKDFEELELEPEIVKMEGILSFACQNSMHDKVTALTEKQQP